MQDDEVIRAHHDQDSSKGTVFSVQLLLPSQFSNPLRRKTNSTILLVSPWPSSRHLPHRCQDAPHPNRSNLLSRWISCTTRWMGYPVRQHIAGSHVHIEALLIWTGQQTWHPEVQVQQKLGCWSVWQQHIYRNYSTSQNYRSQYRRPASCCPADNESHRNNSLPRKRKAGCWSKEGRPSLRHWRLTVPAEEVQNSRYFFVRVPFCLGHTLIWPSHH